MGNQKYWNYGKVKSAIEIEPEGMRMYGKCQEIRFMNPDATYFLENMGLKDLQFRE